MKTAILTLILTFAAQPALAVSSLQREAQALEARMDRTPGDPLNEKTIQQQIKINDDATDFVKAALKIDAKQPLDQPTFTAVARIIVRNFDYDQENQLAEVNAKALTRVSGRLEQVFRQFQREGAFTAERLEQVRFTIGLGTGALRHTNSTEKPAAPAKAPKKTDDGAALSPCQTGLDCPALRAEVRTLAPIASRSAQEIGELSLSSRAK